jgi:hypothetical protein
MEVDIGSVKNVDPIPVQPLTINPLTVADVQKIAPAAVHIKELNQIAPLLVESLRVDHVRHVDPLRIERFDVTSLPTVNLSLSRIPSVDLSVRRVPPIAIALQQQFELPSRYLVRTRLLGFEVMRLEIEGVTRLVPKTCARREQSRAHERSFPDVAAAGNPAIPSRVTQECVATTSRPAQDSPRRAPPLPVRVGAPRFEYALDSRSPPASRNSSTVSSGT